MRTTASTRQLALARIEPSVPSEPALKQPVASVPSEPVYRPDETTAPQSLTWLVYCRENKLLTASEWALAAILVTLGKGQNITLSVVGMADILRMKRETVRKAIDSLIAKGLMVFVRPGRNQTKVYRLTLPRCPNGGHPGDQMGTTQVAESVPPGGQMGTTTLREDQERQEQLHQHPDDDVPAAADTPSGKTKDRAKATARSTSTRASEASSAGKKCRPVEEYVSDLEVCRDDLAKRLGIDPARITVKPLAKTFRSLNARLGMDELFSELLANENLVGDLVWAMSAEKANPVGFLIFALEQRVLGNEITDSYRPPFTVPADVPSKDDLEPGITPEPAPAPDPVRDAAMDLLKEYAELTGQAPGDIEHEFRVAGLKVREVVEWLRSGIDQHRAMEEGRKEGSNAP